MAEESEEACLVNPKSPLNSGQMPYTDGVSATSSASTASGPPTFQQAQSTITHHSGQNTTTANPYDINDDIILSQFHADAIKQASHLYNECIHTIVNLFFFLLPSFLQPSYRIFHSFFIHYLVFFFVSLILFLLYVFDSFFFLQAGCGKFQFIATIIVGLGLAGHAIQVYSIFYILPSAEVEYCILDEEKNWVSNITLLGIGCGSLFFSALASKNGRKKTLLSCLAISSIFSGVTIDLFVLLSKDSYFLSKNNYVYVFDLCVCVCLDMIVIAAFMPAYGPFMMVRFCAAIGIGGAMPAAASYLCEITPLSSRAR